MDPSERFFRSLYEKQYEKMFKLAYRMTGSIEKTQDLVQNAFLLALFRKEELMVHPKPEGWLMTALKNLIFNERRRSESHPEVPLESVIESLSVNDPEMPLELALPKQLSKEDREILILRFEQRLSYAEIGDRLGISEGACRSRLHRALQRCKRFLNDTCFLKFFLSPCNETVCSRHINNGGEGKEG